MKRLLTTTSLMLLLLTSLTSCEWSRQQKIKDAEAKGIATLKEAQNSRQVIIEQARAENEAAEMQAQAQNKIATAQAEIKVKIAIAESQAEIERAKGVAEANRIIGQSMKGNTEYLQYLKIQSLNQANTIYVPTEANLPITEAKR